MRNHLTKFAYAFLSGAVLFQAPGCAETALGITTLSSAITAGAVVYLVSRVVR